MLTHISITGADDNTSIDNLLKLTKDYPYVEWGVLYYPEKEGTKRNPTKDWRNEFLNAIPKNRTAIHLCGEQVFFQIIKDSFETSELKVELSRFGRLQLNINARKLNHFFTNEEVAQIYKKLLVSEFHIIAQYNSISQEAINSFVKTNKVDYDYFDILLDSSLGKGVAPEAWNIPEQFKSGVHLGFAGGLNPENIFDHYLNINKVTKSKYYLDLESGARTENEFDLNKVEKILLQFKNKGFSSQIFL